MEARIARGPPRSRAEADGPPLSWPANACFVSKCSSQGGRANLARRPQGRGGKPEEAPDAVYLFCSPESNYISGRLIACAGGLII